MLYQLPCGDWIDPKTVIAVRCYATSTPEHGICVVTKEGNYTHQCEGNEAAEELRDKVAQQIGALTFSQGGPSRHADG